ncbi:MAG: hypothetical protein II669_03725 [Elusimicrobia bacterium]|nr:hypothetical protein [Elusimicrobiota bacterium]
MIRIIKRCMTESELTEKNWNGHFAFFHLKEFKTAKEVYLNGKKLKWYNRFKNGDIVEIIEKPKGAVIPIVMAIGAKIAAFAAAHPIIASTIVSGVIGIAGTAVAKMVAGRSAAAISTTKNKEYSSTTQPELKGANNEISNDIIPVVFGTTQQTPSYAQSPFRLVNDGGSTNKYHQFFIPNYNNITYSNFKLGETSVNEYSIDYLDIQTLSGGNNFLGFENVKVHTVDEELSYNKKESVNQSSTYYYNQTVSASSVNVQFTIQFSNVDISNFANKTFEIVLNAKNGSTTVTNTQNVTVTSSNVVQSGNNYNYNGNVTFSNTVTEITSIQIAPTANTRGNTKENTNRLEALLTTETLTAGSYTNTVTINQSVNRYSGTVSEVLSTSPENTTEIDVIISFPNGLYKIKKEDGERQARSAKVDIHYKLENGQWQSISSADSIYIRDVDNEKNPISSSTTTVSGSTVTMTSPANLNVADQLFFRPIGFTVPAGKYTVRVRSADFSEKSNYSVGYPNCAEVQFRVTGNVINYDILPDVNQVRFIATAYKGLSGTLQKFNYVAQAKIPIWNGTDWDTTDYTSNPAAIVRYLLTDESVNPRAEKLDHIDNDSLVEYYEWCEESGYKADGIIAEAVKIGEIVNEILKNSQAAMIPLFNGKHTFVIDKPNKTPIGLFNQHNSWDFKWIPNVGRQTEAIRASFVENDDWTEDELTLYWYNGQINTEPEPDKSDSDYLIVKKEYKYVSDRQSVNNIVAYELETTQTKRNTFEFNVNLEALNIMLLDRVYISNTANMQNESTGLIKNVLINNGYLEGFELYSDVDIPENAKIIIRSLDYETEKPVINIYDVINNGYTYKIMTNPVLYDGVIKGAGEIKGIQDYWHYDGDLFTLGQDTIYDCIITNIQYNEDGTATITARDY